VSQFETKMEMAEHLRLFLYAYRQLMENEVGVTTKEYFEKKQCA
jgi:hypothetical protein